MVAVLAVMETPAILADLWLARRHGAAGRDGWARSVSQRRGGAADGRVRHRPRHRRAGSEHIAPFIVAPFQGVLCLFMLEMGLAAGGRGWRDGDDGGLAAFAIAMPLIARRAAGALRR